MKSRQRKPAVGFFQTCGIFLCYAAMQCSRVHRKKRFGSRMQRTFVNLFAVAAASLAVWFFIEATFKAHAVHETCHPVGGGAWSLFIVMLFAWIATALSLFCVCDREDSDEFTVGMLSNSNEGDYITPGQCICATSAVVFLALSVPFLAFTVTSYFTDPLEEPFLRHYEASLNQTLSQNATVPSIEEFEHDGDCLVRSRAPGVYIVFSVTLLYFSLGLLALGNCMWKTRMQRVQHNGGLLGNDSGSDSDDDFPTYYRKSTGIASDETLEEQRKRTDAMRQRLKEKQDARNAVDS